jgi:molecular chaperone GrpE
MSREDTARADKPSPEEKDKASTVKAEGTRPSPESPVGEDQGIAGDPVQEMEAKMEALREEAQETYDRLLRVSAEFDNYKKRMSRELENARKFGTETLLKDLLPVVDNLERAIASSRGEGGEGEGIVEGVGMTLSELLRVLERFQAKPFESVGEPFDPTWHQAFMQEETDRYPEHTVVSEIQKGYSLHGRLLRPAMVVVSKAASGGGAEGGDGEPDDSGS